MMNDDKLFTRVITLPVRSTSDVHGMEKVSNDDVSLLKGSSLFHLPKAH